jgi:hypothetical protein
MNPNLNAQRRGAALLVVLLALALLFSLGVPFLMTGRLRSEAARESFDRARAQVSVQSAGAYAEHIQSGSHPTVDSTPFWDDAGEWDLSGLDAMPQAMGGAWANSEEAWGAEVESAQAKVSLGSAPPLLLQNLLHPCFLTADATFQDSEIQVNSTDGFPETGFVLLGPWWVEYSGKTGNSFTGVTGAANPPEDMERLRFRDGQAVIDQRIVNLAMARMQFGEHRAPEFFSDLLFFNFGDNGVALLPENDQRELERLTWLSTGAFGADDLEPEVWVSSRPTSENPNFLRVFDRQAFSPGTSVRVNFGNYTMDSIVFDTSGSGLWLPQDMPSDLQPWITTVIPMRREPVDINACRPEILTALVLGLRFRGQPPIVSAQAISGISRRHYLTQSKAKLFASAVMQARPIQGPDDLWQRVLDPMILDGSFSHVDAYVVMMNGLDPNNGSLAASTTGFAYRSGDRYLQRMNAALRSRLGRTLARSSHFVDQRVTPPGPLVQVWETQRDFEEAGRYARGLHRTVTLPNNRGALGGHTDWASPIGLSLRTGSWASTGFLGESEEVESSAVLPQPALESLQTTRGAVQHFDLEPSPLGWDFAQQGPRPGTVQQYNLSIGNTGGSDTAPLALQGWFHMPRQGVQNGVLFELAGDYVDRQRITAAFEQGRLIVRGYDNAGDDPSDPENVQQALTVELDPAEYPIENRWFHLNVLMRAIAPGGLQVAIDGVPRGNTHGRTVLTAAASGYAPGDTDQAILVKSTLGFPNRGAIRIGNEVIEYSAITSTSFVTARSPGAQGYIGGRAAREPSDSLVNIRNTDHQVGAGVELYGYSTFLASDIPPGGSTLTGAVGPWSLGVGALGPETIQMLALNLVTFNLGTGFSGDYLGPIELAPVVADDNYYSEAFNASGGYALVVQRQLSQPDTEGFTIGGFEIVRYGSRTGTTLTLTERNVQTPSVTNSWPATYQNSRGFSFVTQWDPSISNINGPFYTDPTMRVFILPISVGGSGVSDLRYLLPSQTNSEFVQITTSGDDALTEWVRYDSIIDGYFLRDDFGALVNAVVNPLLNGNYVTQYNQPSTPPGGGGGGGGGGPGGTGGGGGGNNRSQGSGMYLPMQQPANDNTFTRRIGEPVQNRNVLLNDIAQRLQFRGVMGTYDHAHIGGEELVPVIQTWRPRGESPNAGFVGRLDRVAIMDPTSGNPPFWQTVQWGTAAFPLNDGRTFNNRTYLAFRQSTGIPYAVPSNAQRGDLSSDGRNFLRLVKFPSGERPLGLRSLFLGSGSSGQGGVFSGQVDEFVTGEPEGMGQTSSGIGRGCFMLARILPAGETNSIYLNPSLVVIDGQSIYGSSAGQWISMIPESGLIEIDGERIAYNQYQPGSGILTIAPNGRGLHGTEVANHSEGAKVWMADGRPVAFLRNGMSSTEATFTVNDTRRFGQHNMLLIDQELLHAPIIPDRTTMMMPRYPTSAEDPNGLGDGSLRGRFGTTPSNHGSGTLVYGFPNRWMDLYAPRSNSTAGSWFEIGMSEPGAFWESVQMETDEPDTSHHVRILARSGSARWEDDPETTPGLVLVDRPELPGGRPVPLNLRNDRLDLRVSFDWGVGSFDPVTFLPTAWTVAPRLRHLRLYYMAETRTEREEVIFE